MRAIEHPDRTPIKWGAVASVGFHVAFAMMLLLLPKPQPLQLPPDDGISVEILAPQTAPAPPQPETPAEPRDVPGAAAAAVPPDKPAIASALPGQPAMIRPTRLLSESTLADPRSRAARAALAGLADSERIVQLCGVEAMGQVRAWRAGYRPDRVVAYAIAGVKVGADTMVADGAAFRSKGAWYGLKFKCGVTADHRKVASFEFMVGDPIPRSEWDAHDLAAIH